MCGINGILNHALENHVQEIDLVAMRQIQKARGPDDAGLWKTGNVGFGFNRLSIIDIDGGHQPMLNEDESIALVFNGEIYNYQELRERLSGLGWTFRSRSDTEVILRAWQQWGKECVQQFRGMFAFVIWDSRKRLLFGARDRLGIKPLYYHFDRVHFVFASELKALLELKCVPVEMDLGSLEEYLQHRYVIAPRTILRGIFKVPPAHRFEVRDGELKVERYWDLEEPSPSSQSDKQLVEEFGALMQECMRLHLISDVPLGAFLSGGLDSSAIVAWMSRLGVQKLKTFSIGYDSPESELPFASIVAKHFGTDHHELLLDPSGFRDSFDRVVWQMDEPVGDEASLPLFLLAEFAKRHVTVALSGEGSDELFGGYSRYAQELDREKRNSFPGIKVLARFAAAMPNARLNRFSAQVLTPLERRYRGLSAPFSNSEVKKLFNSPEYISSSAVDDHYQRCKAKSALGRITYLDINTWLADDLLVKADRMSMAASLELRVPFLDHKIVEFAWNLPDRLKIHKRACKVIVKESVSKLLPAAIIYREKKGFPVPLATWFRDGLSDYVMSQMTRSDGITKWLSISAITEIVETHKGEDRSSQLYALMVLDTWCKHYLK